MAHLAMDHLAMAHLTNSTDSPAAIYFILFLAPSQIPSSASPCFQDL